MGPTVVDIPHQLGKAEARRRMHARVGDLGKHLPGGVGDVKTGWPSEDRMSVDVAMMGQTIACLLDVEEDKVRVSVTLPAMLSFAGGMVTGAIRKMGEQMLIEDKSKG